MSSSGASTKNLMIRPAASSGAVVTVTLRSSARSPTVTGFAPRTAVTATVFVFSDLCSEIPNLSSVFDVIRFSPSVFDIFQASSSIVFFEPRNRSTL